MLSTPFFTYTLERGELYFVPLHIHSGYLPLQREWFYYFPKLTLKDGVALYKDQ